MDAPTACLLHADFHVMSGDCWGVTMEWFLAHRGGTDRARRDAYQSAVERKMLDRIRLGRAMGHSIAPAIDRAIRRDHSLCGAEPCSDCR